MSISEPRVPLGLSLLSHQERMNRQFCFNLSKGDVCCILPGKGSFRNLQQGALFPKKHAAQVSVQTRIPLARHIQWIKALDTYLLT